MVNWNSSATKWKMMCYVGQAALVPEPCDGLCYCSHEEHQSGSWKTFTYVTNVFLYIRNIKTFINIFKNNDFMQIYLIQWQVSYLQIYESWLIIKLWKQSSQCTETHQSVPSLWLQTSLFLLLDWWHPVVILGDCIHTTHFQSCVSSDWNTLGGIKLNRYLTVGEP